jgi:hypothetical protein
MTGTHRTRLAVFGVICLVLAVAAPASAAAVAGGVVPTPDSVTDLPDPSPTRPAPQQSHTRPTPPVSPTVTSPPQWSPARCASGAITDVRMERDERGRSVLWISGWIQPCAESGFTNGFTVIRYFPRSGIRTRHPVPYQSPSVPTTFNLRIDAPSGVLQPDLTALCVAYDIDGRVACVRVDATDPGDLPVVAPTATDDPRVLVPVSREIPYETDPTCGTCV